jgi:hypothetical protein
MDRAEPQGGGIGRTERFDPAELRGGGGIIGREWFEPAEPQGGGGSMRVEDADELLPEERLHGHHQELACATVFMETPAMTVRLRSERVAGSERMRGSFLLESIFHN